MVFIAYYSRTSKIVDLLLEHLIECVWWYGKSWRELNTLIEDSLLVDCVEEQESIRKCEIIGSEPVKEVVLHARNVIRSAASEGCLSLVTEI